MSTRRRLRQPRATLDLTSMVDVVFLLVIFFMVSTTFITVESGLPVDLPDAQTSVTEASDLPTVTISKDLLVYFAGQAVAEEALAAMVQQELAASGYTTVILRADRSVPHGTAVRVMDLIKQAGAKRIAIATGE